MIPRTLPAPAPVPTHLGPRPSPGLFERPNPPLRDWTGRHVWLVGASSGIGRALGSALHARGARVVVSARQHAALAAFAEAHPGSTALRLDVTDPVSVRAAAQSVLRVGRLDAVVYCAGHYRALRADDWSLEEMLRHQQVNYVGALHLLDAVLPALLAQEGGHLSLVGSVAGYRGLPRSLAYGPTKAALILLAETLWLDLRGRGIGVSLVSPGFVDTPLTAHNEFHMPALMTPAAAAQAILHGWSQGRFEIDFPKRFTLAMKLLRLLPFPLYQWLVRRTTGL
ncbi:MAG TPA: SDR family NAD(P)-dependent oxidoreductase [Ramlibacter sp.]|jgi:NAD(P)-dependent dehydrogenase (short-subunit alcohol dehydrogenase family)|uniref:SDR family NAD(P)-dependent oxidoreductase n=1 Tax=Ramlibacter sp. TaxID=1917967 RepID=UPI002D32748C|nr:SDR family NAD(P)-dependent oxidoreductase [Ramlibacter sp.]HZY17131.1 SDR family NAD(P)-dependent oxidoreductase [Ramlibacter sp.]